MSRRPPAGPAVQALPRSGARAAIDAGNGGKVSRVCGEQQADMPLTCRLSHWIGGAGHVPGLAATVSGSASATPSTETKGISVFRLSFIVRMNSLAIMA